VIFEIENGSTEIAHLRDPGRLKELLIPGVKLLIRKALPNPKRKTKYDVIAVLNHNIWVLINSGFHSDIADELIESGLIREISDYSIQRREYTYGKSRIDFILTKQDKIKMFLEVKGCTLVEDGLAKFPDAPTLRGKKHLGELSHSLDQGFNAAVLFLILRDDVLEFTPNKAMDLDFSDALIEANEKGVLIIAYSFRNIYKNDSPYIKPFKRIDVKLDL
jgi:sugar fermentation stimulation protein A